MVRLADGTGLPVVYCEQRRQQVRIERTDRSAAIFAAQAQWHEARSVVGTLAERYLASRGIVGPDATDDPVRARVLVARQAAPTAGRFRR